MRWDLGLQGLGLLIVMSLGFGMIAQLVVGRATTRWLWLIAAAGYFIGGLFVSEVWFGVGDPGGAAAQHRRSVLRRGAAARPGPGDRDRARHPVRDAEEPAPFDRHRLEAIGHIQDSGDMKMCLPRATRNGSTSPAICRVGRDSTGEASPSTTRAT
jgi:hypothetical protein